MKSTEKGSAMDYADKIVMRASFVALVCWLLVEVLT
jgi:hypothetical protein